VGLDCDRCLTIRRKALFTEKSELARLFCKGRSMRRTGNAATALRRGIEKDGGHCRNRVRFLSSTNAPPPSANTRLRLKNVEEVMQRGGLSETENGLAV